MDLNNIPAKIKEYGLLPATLINKTNDLILIEKLVSSQRDGTQYLSLPMTIEEFLKLVPTSGGGISSLKTINGNSLLGVGNISVAALIGYTPAAVNPTSTFLPYNNTGTFADSLLSQTGLSLKMTAASKLIGQGGGELAYLDVSSGTYSRLAQANGFNITYETFVDMNSSRLEIYNRALINLNVFAGGQIRLGSLTGGGMEMVNIDASGNLGRQAIPTSLAINPTPGALSYNNSGVLGDSWLSQDASNVFIVDGKDFYSVGYNSNLHLGSGSANYGFMNFLTSAGGNISIGDGAVYINHTNQITLSAPLINIFTIQTGNAGLASGDLYVDTAANILANADLIVARKV